MKPSKKSVLCSIFTAGATASALAQGTLVFENLFSNGNIYMFPKLNTLGPGYLYGGVA